MKIGILGILKAGCAYLPLDPEYPRERLTYMIEDSGLSHIVSLSSIVDKLPVSEARTICLDSNWDSIAEFSQVSPETSLNADNLAYVIYTSGSTGKPKGVLVEHAQLPRYDDTQHQRWRLNGMPKVTSRNCQHPTTTHGHQRWRIGKDLRGAWRRLSRQVR